MAGTSTKTKVIGIRVPVALMAELEALAKTRGVTVSALCLEGVQVVVNRGPEIVAPQSSKARPSMQQMRRDPTMKAVEPTPDGKGLVAAVLPVTGTEFPARPVYLRGQQPAKGKKA